MIDARRLRRIVLTLSLFALCASSPRGVPLLTPAALDNHRGFDFLAGTWSTHYRILRHRLSGDHVWYDCYGHSIVRRFWDGSGNLEVGDLRCPPPRGRTEGMTLRTYDGESHQWTLYWGTKKLGLTLPAQVGHFDVDGTGRFYAADTYEGRPVIVRFQWTLRTGDRPRFEQAFSIDRGRTWETNWTTDYTRIPARDMPVL